MEKWTLPWKTGCVYPVSPQKECRTGDLYLSREALSLLCPRLKALVLGNLTITASPDTPAMYFYAENRWDALAPKIQINKQPISPLCTKALILPSLPFRKGNSNV